MYAKTAITIWKYALHTVNTIDTKISAQIILTFYFVRCKTRINVLKEFHVLELTWQSILSVNPPCPGILPPKSCV